MTIPTVFDNRGGLRKPEVKRPGSAGVRLPPLPVKPDVFRPAPKKPVRRRRGTAQELGFTLIGKKRDFVLEQILRTPPVSARGSRLRSGMTSPRASKPTSPRQRRMTSPKNQPVTFDPNALSLHLENLQIKPTADGLIVPAPKQPILPKIETTQTSIDENRSNISKPKVAPEEKDDITKTKVKRELMTHTSTTGLEGLTRLFSEPQGKQLTEQEVEEARLQQEQKMNIACGRYALDQIPPLPKKVVRIFISSTFTGQFCLHQFAIYMSVLALSVRPFTSQFYLRALEVSRSV